MAYLTGFHAIEERIKAGWPGTGPLLVAKPGPRARELVNLALQKKIRVDRVGTNDLDRISTDHRGIALQIDEENQGGELTTARFLEELGDSNAGGKKDALVLILDEITDPHNYGAILRSCDQFGVDLVITRNRRTAKHADIIATTSAGAAAWVPSCEEANLSRVIERLKEAGFWIYGADMAGNAVFKQDLRGRIAIILGGEGPGISRLLKESCDGLIAIPTRGRIDSLNVSVACGVLLYEVSRQRSKG